MNIGIGISIVESDLVCLECQILECDETHSSCQYRQGKLDEKGLTMSQRYHKKLYKDPVRMKNQRKKWHEQYLRKKAKIKCKTEH